MKNVLLIVGVVIFVTKAVDRIKMGEVNQVELQQVLLTFQSSFSDNKLDSLEALNLLEGINQLGDQLLGSKRRFIQEQIVAE